MITIGPNYSKLRTSLQLAATRLKILQGKKLELVEKLKLEVANYIKSGKYMKAKLSAQTVVKDEATIEAMELIEIYCNQILERYGLFQQMKRPDISIVVPITNLIWVAPHYETFVEELKVISKQFFIKYGAYACKLALTNKTGKVNPELIKRVRQLTPSDEEVENCLKNICSKYGIIYTRKCLASTDNDEKFNSNIEPFFFTDSDSEFSVKEINEESFSRKKRAVGSKIKLRTTKADEQNQEISDKMCDNKVTRKSSQQTLCGKEIEDRCETITYPITDYSEDSPETNFKFENSSEDKSWRKSERNIPSNISLFDDCCVKKPTAPDVSAIADSHFYTNSFGVSYPDPPPPYSYHCLPENKTDDRKGTWEDFIIYQLPSCPTENPFSRSAPELQKKKEEK